MRSLTFKLTLAFLLVGLTGSVLVAVITWRRTRSAFDQFILNREQQILAQNLLQYFDENGDWQGIENNLTALLSAPRRDSRQDLLRDETRFILVGADQKVVYSNDRAVQVSQKIAAAELKRAVLLQSSGKTAGWLLFTTTTQRQWIPDSPEERFLGNITSAALLSALIATFLALTLGGMLAFTLTRSLRELTEATVEIARGRFGMQVKVRSSDELGELATSFNKMSVDLDRATQARRQMTADIAHDLRSPLSVISGYAEALSDGKLPGTSEVYNVLYQETKQLSRLIEDLRLLSLADAGELPLTLQPIQPQLMIERVAIRHAVAAQQKEIALQVMVEPGLPLVEVDVERMAQVFDNLIVNAFRYTPQGGTITLRAAPVHGRVLLQIQDSGVGIAAEDLPHIFDRFYRGDKSRQQADASGLGLAIARSIVEAQGGTISAENAPGQGAVFTISLQALEAS